MYILTLFRGGEIDSVHHAIYHATAFVFWRFMDAYLSEASLWVSRRARCTLNGENWLTTTEDMQAVVLQHSSSSKICAWLAGFHYIDYVH